PSLGALPPKNALMTTEETVIPIDSGTYSRDAMVTTLATIEFIQEETNYALNMLEDLICNVKEYTVYDSTAEKAVGA
ncbi:unnamed protein product, partial [marine sediment metagenome]